MRDYAETADMDQKLTGDDAAIMAVLDAETAAYFRNDLEGLAACWLQTGEARRLWSGPQTGTTVTIGWDDVYAGFSKAMRLRPSNFDSHDYLERKNLQICRSGDMAWVYYDQGLKRNHPNFYTQTDQKELKIFHRVDGDWKLACLVIIAPALMKDDLVQIRLDADGLITRMSQAAEEKLPEFDGLVLKGRRVHAAKLAHDPDLQAEISSKLEFMSANFPPSAKNRNLRPIPLGTDDYSRPMYCWVFVEGDELVITFDAAQSVTGRLASAADAFGLSPAQSRLAGLLAEGRDLQAIADTLEVSVNTVKTHLRRMFEKTGTHDQAGLLALLLSVEKPVQSPPRMA